MSPIFNGTILVNFLVSSLRTYHSLWISVKETKDLLEKAY